MHHVIEFVYVTQSLRYLLGQKENRNEHLAFSERIAPVGPRLIEYSRFISIFCVCSLANLAGIFFQKLMGFCFFRALQFLLCSR